MSKKLGGLRVSVSLALALIFAIVCVAPCNEAMAFRSPQPTKRQVHKPRVPHSRVHHHRPVVRLLPLGVAMLTIAGIHYYYHRDRDVYYRRVPSGYAAVLPPAGAFVARLPIGHTAFFVGGARYFYYGGAYYRTVPSGYIVVDPPYVTPPAGSIGNQTAPSSYSGTVSVTAQLLNVRAGPGLEHPVLCQLRQGSLLEVHGSSSGWFYVRIPSGEYGWVMTRFTASPLPPPRG